MVIVLELLLLALGLYGDGRLIHRAFRHPEDRFVCTLAAIVVTALVAGLGFVTLVTLALERCGNDCFA
jgi:hypothetical protein